MTGVRPVFWGSIEQGSLAFHLHESSSPTETPSSHKWLKSEEWTEVVGNWQVLWQHSSSVLPLEFYFGGCFKGRISFPLFNSSLSLCFMSEFAFQLFFRLAWMHLRWFPRIELSIQTKELQMRWRIQGTCLGTFIGSFVLPKPQRDEGLCGCPGDQAHQCVWASLSGCYPPRDNKSTPPPWGVATNVKTAFG